MAKMRKGYSYLALLCVFLLLPLANGDVRNRRAKSTPWTCNEGLGALGNVEHLSVDAFKNKGRLREDLTQAFRQFDVAKFGVANDEGFILKHKDPSKPRDLRIVRVPHLPGDFKNLMKETWSIHDTHFDLVNVGFKNFENYSMRVSQIVIDHLSQYPDQNLKVIYDPVRIHAGKVLRAYRWALHDAVMKVYRKRKPYLTEKDFETLLTVNLFTTNSDVFGLVNYDSDPGLDLLSQEEINESLLFTIQITYLGNQSYFTPNIRQIIAAAGLNDAFDKDLLPFEYRLAKYFSSDFRLRFFQRFDPQKTCEILRFALFTKLPDDVKDGFILNAFQTLMGRGMKHIVISVDKATARLFSSRYGFKPYPVEPEIQGREKEFIYYLDVDSPEFVAIYNKLLKSSRAIQVSRQAS